MVRVCKLCRLVGMGKFAAVVRLTLRFSVVRRQRLGVEVFWSAADCFFRTALQGALGTP